MSSFFDSPLWGITLILLVITIIAVLYDRISRNTHGVCPKCGKEFKASPFELIFTIHVFYKFYLKCPHCGDRSMVPFLKDKNKTRNV